MHSTTRAWLTSIVTLLYVFHRWSQTHNPGTLGHNGDQPSFIWSTWVFPHLQEGWKPITNTPIPYLLKVGSSRRPGAGFHALHAPSCSWLCPMAWLEKPQGLWDHTLSTSTSLLFLSSALIWNFISHSDIHCPVPSPSPGNETVQHSMAARIGLKLKHSHHSVPNTHCNTIDQSIERPMHSNLWHTLQG